MRKKNRQLVLGQFVIATVTAIATKSAPGNVTYPKGGVEHPAFFSVYDRHKIVIVAGQDVPELGHIEHGGTTKIGGEIVAFVETQGQREVVVAWGHAFDYRKAIKEIGAKKPVAVSGDGPKPAPTLPGTAHVPIRKFHPNSHPPLPRKCMTLAAMRSMVAA